LCLRGKGEVLLLGIGEFLARRWVGIAVVAISLGGGKIEVLIF